MSNRPRIAFDSCALLHLLMQHPTHSPALKVAFNDAAAGKVDIVVCEVSIAECSRLESTGSPPLSQADQISALANFFRSKFLIRRAVTSRESEFAAGLIRNHGLGACDALIAATAAFADAGSLYTTDGCSRRRKPGKLLSVGTIQTACGKQMNVLEPVAYKCP